MISLSSGELRVLDFDLENRPLAYWVDEMSTAEITAIAASWIGTGKTECRVLTTDPKSARRMLLWFINLYNQADMVTGHSIKQHDLRILNAACLELGLEPLKPKLAQDTHADLKARKYLSASQEALSAMYHLPHAKHHMTQEQWREANRLTKTGIKQTMKRVCDDVIQHMALREKLIEHDMLHTPKMWRP